MTKFSVPKSWGMRHLVPWVAGIAALALSVLYLLHIGRDRISETAPQPYTGTMLDFRDAVWLPSRYFLEGNDPYDSGPYLRLHPYAQEFDPYTPGHLFPWSPMGTLPWDVAVAVYLTLSGIVVCAVGAWGGQRVLRQINSNPSTGALVTAAAAGVIALWVSRPPAAAVSLGQPSAFYALLAVPAVIGIRSKLGSALLVGLACLKPQIGLPVLVLLLAQRRIATLVAGLGVAAALSLPGVLMLAHGAGGIPEWIGAFLRNAEVSRHLQPASAARLFRIDLEALGVSFGWSLSTLTVIALSVSTLIVAYFAQRLGGSLKIHYVGTALALAIGLLSLFHGYYDACWLLFPTALAVAQLAGLSTTTRLSCLPGLALLALIQLTTSRVDPVLGSGAGVAIERVLLTAGVIALGVGFGRLVMARGAQRSSTLVFHPGGEACRPEHVGDSPHIVK